MKNSNEIETIKKKIIPILKRHKIARAGIFGSYARGDQKKNSDVDILIEAPKGVKFSLFDLVGLQIELEKTLKKKVDLITYNGISPYIKEYALKEEVLIL